MSEWQCLPIRDLIDSQWPGEWGSEHNPYAPAVVVYRSTDIDDDGHLLEESGGVYRSLDSKKVAAKKLLPGDILLEASGGAPDRPVGRVAVFSGVRSELSVCANFLRTLRPKKGVSSDFLRWVLLSLQRQSAIWRYQQQTTGIINLKVADYLNHKIETPPFPQQRRIAEILSTLDEAIERTEALIAKHQQIKAGLMHDLFTRGVTPEGHLRPTRELAPGLYKESPLGWMPKDWEVEKLGDILRRCGGYLQTGPFGSQLHAHEYQVEGVPVVMPQDINDGLIGIGQIARIHEGRAEELARHRMRIGDIVIARRGDLSRAAAISTSEQGWVCGTGCFLLRLGQSTLRPDYAAYVYRQNFIQRQIAATAVGTTMPSLNNSVMEALLFPFCGEDEQLRIVERLKGVEQEIHALTEGLFANRQLKHGLMHDLLTGRVRVTTTEQ